MKGKHVWGKTYRKSFIWSILVCTFMVFNFGGIVSASSITCDSCSDCTSKLDGSYDLVLLNTTINNSGGTCIEFNANSVVFDCQSNTIDGDGGDYGIYLYSSSDNNITGSRINSNRYGVNLGYSDNNTVLNNEIKNNAEYGVYFDYRSNDNNLSLNTICLNNFINGMFGLFTVENTSSNNFYKTNDKITYSYKGKTFTNYLGNYWDGYHGNDDNNDGIGDSAIQYYDTNEFTMDSYPLMEPVENYKLNVSGETIPGYNIFFLFSVVFLISLIITMRAKIFKRY